MVVYAQNIHNLKSTHKRELKLVGIAVQNPSIHRKPLY